jgi:hypothetical protein
MDADDLYGLPLDRFVSERAELAKSLRKAGRRDEAKKVAALRKPSIAAWAVNQVVRTQRAKMQSLLDAGDELRNAQSDLLEGRGDGRALRSAGERERTLVDELVAIARGLLTSQGEDLSATALERVGDSLHAAALDEDAREQVRDGRLERELRHVGLGLGEGAASPRAPRVERPARDSPRPRDSAGAQESPTRPAAAKTSSERAKDPAGSQSGSRGAAQGDALPDDSAAKRRAERERVAREDADAERAQRERRAARTAARAAVETARRRSRAAGSALERAEQERERAERALKEADDALAAAREHAASAAEELDRAEAERADAEPPPGRSSA